MSNNPAQLVRTTIIIPTFNRSELLKKAVASALGQSVVCDVIVVDHGSSDATEAVVRALGDQVTYLRREVDHGPIFSWVDGVLNCKTPFVKLLFDDDYLAPDFVESCENLMNDDVGFVVTQAEVVGLENGRVLSTRFQYLDAETSTYSNASQLGKVVESVMISPSALLLRRSEALDALYLGKLPFQRYSYFGAGPDHYLKLFAMLHYPKFGYVAKPLSSFGSHPQSITTRALQSSPERLALKRAYREVWIFYRILKGLKRLLPFFRYPRPRSLARRLLNQIVLSAIPTRTNRK